MELRGLGHAPAGCLAAGHVATDEAARTDETEREDCALEHLELCQASETRGRGCLTRRHLAVMLLLALRGVKCTPRACLPGSRWTRGSSGASP